MIIDNDDNFKFTVSNTIIITIRITVVNVIIKTRSLTVALISFLVNLISTPTISTATTTTNDNDTFLRCLTVPIIILELFMMRRI